MTATSALLTTPVTHGAAPTYVASLKILRLILTFSQGMDLVSCAASYGVTGLSTIPTVAATGVASSTSASAGPITSSTASPTTTAGGSHSNSTVTTGTAPQFTGAANVYAVGGYALPLVLAGAAIAAV